MAVSVGVNAQASDVDTDIGTKTILFYAKGL
jgi:hypothetical protein